MSDWTSPVLVLSGITLSSFVTYCIARRTTSGSISTSDAASLWDESNKLRREYRERNETLEEQLKEVNQKLQSVMDELNKLRSDSGVMIQKIEELKEIITALREENARLLSLAERGTS